MQPKDVMMDFTAYDDSDDCHVLDQAEFEAVKRSTQRSKKVWMIGTFFVK